MCGGWSYAFYIVEWSKSSSNSEMCFLGCFPQKFPSDYINWITISWLQQKRRKNKEKNYKKGNRISITLFLHNCGLFMWLWGVNLVLRWLSDVDGSENDMGVASSLDFLNTLGHIKINRMTGKPVICYTRSRARHLTQEHVKWHWSLKSMFHSPS